MTEQITTVFDNRNLAQAAVDELHRRGIDESLITVSENYSHDEIFVTVDANDADAHLVRNVLERNAGRSVVLA